MGVHHIAFATRDVERTHRFYSEAMGFDLVKVEIAKIGNGWAKHLFYATGSPRDQMIAFWDLHDDSLGDEWSADISRGLGLPAGVNHLAFTAGDLADIARRRERWLGFGVDVLEIDHGWCTSIYTEDPNRIVVEFCTLTQDFTEADRKKALELLHDPAPALESGYVGQKLYKASEFAAGR